MNIMGWILFVQVTGGVPHTADVSPYIFRIGAECEVRGQMLLREQPWFSAYECRYGYVTGTEKGVVIVVEVSEPRAR